MNNSHRVLTTIDQMLVFWKKNVHLFPNSSIFSFMWQECTSLHGEYAGRACGHGHPYVPDVLFWSVILFFSTVTMSATLKQFKTSRYFPTKVLRLHFSWFKIKQHTSCYGVLCSLRQKEGPLLGWKEPQKKTFVQGTFRLEMECGEWAGEEEENT
jgi:hypothetical protein